MSLHHLNHLNHLASMSAPVISATLLMEPPNGAPRRRQQRQRASLRTTLKRFIRPLVPQPVRQKARLVLVSSNPDPAPVARAEHPKHSSRAA